MVGSTDPGRNNITARQCAGRRTQKQSKREDLLQPGKRRVFAKRRSKCLDARVPQLVVIKPETM